MSLLRKIFSHQTKGITTAAILVGISTFLSRILGFLRDGLLIARFGATQDLDIYFTAFRIPDLIYGILITGGVIAVFIPLFSERFKKGEKEAFEFTNNLLNIFLFILISLATILFIFTPPLVKILAPGFSPEELRKTILLTRILFLSPIIFGASAILSGVLQFFNAFLAYSLAPIFYNLGIISGIIFFSKKWGILGVVFGVIIGAFFHLLIQLPSAFRLGFRYRFVFNFKDEVLRRAFHLMIPRSIGAAAYHISLIVMTTIGSFLSPGSITVFNISNNLQYFPVGVVGISFAIASFPSFSKSWTFKKREKFFLDVTSTIRKILFIVLPLSAVFFVMRYQIVALLNLSGKFILGKTFFSQTSIWLTSLSLGIFSFGIFALSLAPLLTRIFFSFQDTKTPVISVLLSIAINIVLAIIFVFLLGYSHPYGKDIRVLSLPLSSSIAAIFHATFLYFFLEKKFFEFGILEHNFWQEKKKELSLFVKKIVFLTIIFSIFTWFPVFLLNKIINYDSFWQVFFEVLISLLIGFFTFIYFSQKLKISEENSLRRLIFQTILGLKKRRKFLK